MEQQLFFEAGVTWAEIQLGITERLLNVKVRPRKSLGLSVGRTFTLSNRSVIPS